METLSFTKYRKIHGPLRPFSIDAVNDFYKCGDLSAGFTRLQCPNPDCGHERLLAFTCKSRHICPACHQRRVSATGDWIAETLCKPVPHRQFVFTMPRMLRGIFRKRRRIQAEGGRLQTGGLGNERIPMAAPTKQTPFLPPACGL